MTWYLYLAALGAAASGANAIIEHGEPAEMADADVLEMQRERYERMTVPVTIMGEGPFRFMIDTGAQATVLASSLADQLALNDRRTAILVGMASRQRIQTTEVPEFGIGKRMLTIQTAPLVERGNIGGADGILGLDSLQDLRVLIDFRAGTIAVDDAEALGGDRGYEIVVRARRKLGRLIIADALIDGVRTAVVIDTGAQGNLGNPVLQKRLRAQKQEQVRSTDVHGVDLIGNLDFVERLKIDRFELANVPVAFADGPAFAALGLDKKPALILGMRDLRLFDRVAIDFGSRTVLFDLPPDVGDRMDEVRQKYSATRL